MTPDIVFQIVNFPVIIVWMLMIFAPKWKVTNAVVSSFSVIIFVSLIYVFLIFSSINEIDFKDFGSMDGVVKLFKKSDVWGVSGIWYHILAFDLFAGSWIFNDARKIRIPHLILIPSLFFTFMLGPFGFLLYQLTKFLYTRFSRRGRLNK